MKIKGAYYQEGGVTEDDLPQTPHIKDEDNNKVFFLIRCAVCHNGLCKMITVVKTEVNDSKKHKSTQVFVQPCPI